MKYSFIVPVYNHKIDHLEKSALESKDSEWIFIETNIPVSTKILNSKVIKLHKAGYGIAVNSGAKIAKGEYLVIMNDDVHLEENYLEKIVCEENEIAVPVVYDYLSKKIESRGSKIGFLYYNRLNKEIPEGDIEITGSMFIVKKDFFLQCRGFDEEFEMYYEDVDLSKRIKKIGGKVVLLPNFNVYHEHSSSRISNKRYYLQRNRLFFIAKHTTSLTRLYIYFFTIEIIIMLVQTVRHFSVFPIKARLDALKLLKRFYEKTH